MSILSDKIKNLRNYKVYDYTLFDDQNKITVESYISRAAKKGEIIKIGKGKFYKRASNINNHNIPQFINHPRDKVALRHNKISPSKYPIFSKLFWSNRNVAIYLDNYIGVILSKDDPSYLPYLRELFGDRKVYEVYLNHFYQQNRRLELIEEFLEIWMS